MEDPFNEKGNDTKETKRRRPAAGAAAIAGDEIDSIVVRFLLD